MHVLHKAFLCQLRVGIRVVIHIGERLARPGVHVSADPLVKDPQYLIARQTFLGQLRILTNNSLIFQHFFGILGGLSLKLFLNFGVEVRKLPGEPDGHLGHIGLEASVAPGLDTQLCEFVEEVEGEEEDDEMFEHAAASLGVGPAQEGVVLALKVGDIHHNLIIVCRL